MRRCYTRHGRRAHYTRDGVLTLCNRRVHDRDLGIDHWLPQAAMCFRCEKAEEAVT